jgi:hypothetical protein
MKQDRKPSLDLSTSSASGRGEIDLTAFKIAPTGVQLFYNNSLFGYYLTTFILIRHVMQDKQERSLEKGLNIKPDTLTEVDMRNIPNIPMDVATNILASYLEPGDCIALTHKFPGMFRQQFKENVQRLILGFVLKRDLNGLASYLSTAERLGITGGSLFLQKATATDYSGHQFTELSPLQAAFLRHDPQMARILLKHIDLKNPREATACAAQLTAIGPIPTYNSLPECDYDFEQLATAISISTNADRAATLASDWRKETYTPVCALDGTLNAFRVHFDAAKFNNIALVTPQARIMHYWFNPKPLIKALEVYAVHLDAWSADECRVFWRLVLGYLKRHLPASYAQAICDGLASIVEKKLALSWGLAANAIHYYPLGPGTPGDFLGFDFSWRSYWAGATAAADDGVDDPAELRGVKARIVGRHIEKLCRTNIESLSLLAEHVWPATPESGAAGGFQCRIL